MTTISVITATYNAASTVVDCLRSVASQTHPCEQIAIDGVSTDNTIEAVRCFSSQIRIISEPDMGIYDAMNKGICMASGDIIAILNADDFYASPRVLEKVARVFEDPAVMSCYGDLEYVRDSSMFKVESSRLNTEHETSNDFSVVRYWRSGSFSPQKFYWGWMPPHPTFFVRRSIYEHYGLFRLDMGSAADYELMLRLLLKERITCTYIPEVLVRMRTGGASNVSLEARMNANRMDRKAWTVNGLKPYPWTTAMKPLRKLPQYVRRAVACDIEQC